jgi:HEAT repeat protein
MPFRLPSIDGLSFWIGAALATALWWLLAALRPLFGQLIQALQTKRKEKKEKARAASAVEERCRQLVFQQAQGAHLAAPLFSLDEILLPPRLLLPPAPGASEDIVSLALPYLPETPELAAIYRAPTLTLPQAMAGGGNLVLIGRPGSGKTVALAHLASLAARRDADSGLPSETFPILAHVADLGLPLKNPEALLDPLIEILAARLPVRDLPRLPGFVQRAFNEGRLLFLLDGLDELPPEEMKSAAAYLEKLRQTYPATRLVTVAAPECLDGLPGLDFIPFALAAWGAEQRGEFLGRWRELWGRFVAVEAWVQGRGEAVEPLLLEAWLDAGKGSLTPLELTLEAWAAFGGDAQGPRPLEAIQAHLRRLAPADVPAEAVELLALQTSLALKPVFEPRQAREWVKSFEPPEAFKPNEAERAPRKGRKASKEEKAAAKPGVLAKMAAGGLLIQHRSGRMRFAHPVFAGCLAGKALVNYRAETILEQPEWSGKSLALRSLAAHRDVAALAETLLAASKRPLHQKLLAAGGWLREASPQMAWRGNVMAKLAALLQDQDQPLGLRGRALAAFVLSGDPAGAALCRQLHRAAAPEVAQLAALGSGAMQDAKAIEGLAGLLDREQANVQRAACLALVAIGSSAALDAAGSALLHGSENLRRFAAEALANHPQDGRAMLREGASVEDLLVRRAAAYGLGRVEQPWAGELLAKLQVEDKEWIVRASAAEVIEARQRARLRLPAPLPPPSESPWLISFAGKHGMGISPNQPADDLLLLALKEGGEEERLGALAYLRQSPAAAVLRELYHVMYGGDPLLREPIFQLLWELAASGAALPDPQQFGVG